MLPLERQPRHGLGGCGALWTGPQAGESPERSGGTVRHGAATWFQVLTTASRSARTMEGAVAGPINSSNSLTEGRPTCRRPNLGGPMPAGVATTRSIQTHRPGLWPLLGLERGPACCLGLLSPNCGPFGPLERSQLSPLRLTDLGCGRSSQRRSSAWTGRRSVGRGLRIPGLGRECTAGSGRQV